MRQGARTHHGKRTRAAYDAASGVTATWYADGVFSRLKSGLAGNVVEAAGEPGVIRCRYDAGGRVVGDGVHETATCETAAYGYDPTGRCTRMGKGSESPGFQAGSTTRQRRLG